MTAHHTQWAAQFAVASELCKRGYEVSFTMGNNTPLADLMAISPTMKTMFLVDVKGQSTKNFWRIKTKGAHAGLFYILAYVPRVDNNRFFILSQVALNELLREYEFSGVKYDPRFSGLNWKTPHSSENRWDLLPE